MLPLCYHHNSREESSVAPTLEEEVFKLDDNDRTMYVLIQQTHKGVSSIGHKLAEFRGETAENFKNLRTEMLDEFSAVRDTTADIRADVISLKADLRRVQLRMDKFNGASTASKARPTNTTASSTHKTASSTSS